MAKDWKYGQGGFCQNCDEDTQDLQEYNGIFICNDCLEEQEEFGHYDDDYDYEDDDNYYDEDVTIYSSS